MVIVGTGSALDSEARSESVGPQAFSPATITIPINFADAPGPATLRLSIMSYPIFFETVLIMSEAA